MTDPSVGGAAERPAEPDVRNKTLTGSRLTMTDFFKFERRTIVDWMDSQHEVWDEAGSIEPRDPTVAEVSTWLAEHAPVGEPREPPAPSLVDIACRELVERLHDRICREPDCSRSREWAFVKECWAVADRAGAPPTQDFEREQVALEIEQVATGPFVAYPVQRALLEIVTRLRALSGGGPPHETIRSMEQFREKFLPNAEVPEAPPSNWSAPGKEERVSDDRLEEIREAIRLRWPTDNFGSRHCQNVLWLIAEVEVLRATAPGGGTEHCENTGQLVSDDLRGWTCGCGPHRRRAAQQAPGGCSPPQNATAQQVAECCALVCESRAHSLRYDSSRLYESNEAHKCAAAIRGGWQDMLQHLPVGVARPGEDAPRSWHDKLTDSEQKAFAYASESRVMDTPAAAIICELLDTIAALRGTPPSRTEPDMLRRIASLIGSDSYAMTFQTLGQYRAALGREVEKMSSPE